MKKEQRIIEYNFFDHISELDDLSISLISEAKKACKNAYAPYSKFKVGCALQMENGEIVNGSNQENIAYPSGLCAERTALFYAGSKFPHLSVSKLAIVSEGQLIHSNQVLSPCGSCRQVMAETVKRQGKEFEIILVNNDDSAMVFSGIESLLPFVFGNKEK